MAWRKEFQCHLEVLGLIGRGVAEICRRGLDPADVVRDVTGMNLCGVVGAAGFEPATPCAQGKCATRLRYAPTEESLILLRFPQLALSRAFPRLTKLSLGRGLRDIDACAIQTRRVSFTVMPRRGTASRQTAATTRFFAVVSYFRPMRVRYAATSCRFELRRTTCRSICSFIDSPP